MKCEIDKAKELAGERERKLMEKGIKKSNFNTKTGELSWTWTHGKETATYDINKHRWIA